MLNRTRDRLADWVFQRGLVLVVVSLAIVLMSGDGADAKRVALVVGNANYQHTTTLGNTINDANAMKELLSNAALDFEVIDAMDTTKREFIGKLKDFSKAADGAEIAVVFYSGHGIQIDGKNYIVPVDADLNEADPDFDLEEYVVSMEKVLLSGSAAKTALYFLDACRDNPFLGQIFGNDKGGGQPKGFTFEDPSLRSINRAEAPQTFIGFATAANTTATTGTGELSPYTAALVRHLSTPDQEFSVVFGQVIQSVKDETDGKQVPTRTSNLVSLKLVDTGAATVSPASNETGRTFPSEEPAEAKFCQSARNASMFANTPEYCSRAKGQWRIYMQLFPNGSCAKEAQLQLDQLNSNEACEVALQEDAQSTEPRASDLIQNNDLDARFCEKARELTFNAVDCRQYRLAKFEWASYLASYPEGMCSREVIPRQTYLDTQISSVCEVARDVDMQPEEADGFQVGGTYAGVRGYTSSSRPKPNSECQSRYTFEAEVSGGEISFWSDGRTFSGFIDEHNRIRITNMGLMPPTNSRFSIVGEIWDAKMFSSYCGPGYFRLIK